MTPLSCEVIILLRSLHYLGYKYITFIPAKELIALLSCRCNQDDIIVLNAVACRIIIRYSSRSGIIADTEYVQRPYRIQIDISRFNKVLYRSSVTVYRLAVLFKRPAVKGIARSYKALHIRDKRKILRCIIYHIKRLCRNGITLAAVKGYDIRVYRPFCIECRLIANPELYRCSHLIVICVISVPALKGISRLSRFIECKEIIFNREAVRISGSILCTVHIDIYYAVSYRCPHSIQMNYAIVIRHKL